MPQTSSDPSARPSPPTARFITGLAAILVAYHLGLWAWTARSRGFSLLDVLDRWDSEHYSRIVMGGYVDTLAAFLPLYPGWVWLGRVLTGGVAHPAVVGVLLSTALFGLYVLWISSLVRAGEQSPLLPGTKWAWFLFLFSPASFSLHSHHTEGLFVLLSFGALWCASKGQPWRTAAFAALCIWTRNQGLVVAGCAALLLMQHAPGWRSRLARLGGLSASTVAAYGALLLFHAYVSGDPLAHLHAQRNWNHVDSWSGVMKGMMFQNPWQSGPGFWPVLRHLFGFALLFVSLSMTKKQPTLALYGTLSVLIMLPQGDFGNAFRFGAVLFPVLFHAGNWIARRPTAVRWVCALLVIWLNHKVTHRFALGNWAY